MSWSPLFPCVLCLDDVASVNRDSQPALPAHSIILKNMILLGPNSEFPLSAHQIPRFVNYYGFGKYGSIFYSIEELITFRRDLSFKAVIPS